MASTDSLKRALMGIGLLTVLAVGAVAALVAYVWWDSRTAVDDEFETGAALDETEFDAGDADGATTDDEVGADDAGVTAD